MSSFYVLRFVASSRNGYTDKLEDAWIFPTHKQCVDFIDRHATEEVAGDWTSYREDALTGKLAGVFVVSWDADFGHVRMIVCPENKLGELTSDQTQDLPDITSGDIQYLNNLHQQKSPSMKTETRSKLKAIVQEVLSEMTNKEAKKSIPTEKTEVMKKAALPQDNTQMKAHDKSVTSTSEPKEKTESKKLPVVKKPATPTVAKESLKESIIKMIREELDEMARTPMTINNGVVSGAGAKFIVKDPASSTGYSLKGHPKFPDGTPANPPKGPYVPKGNAGMGRPASEESVNGSIDVKVDGKSLGQFDLSAKLPSGKPDMTPMQKRLRQFIYNDPDMAAYEIDPSVEAKFEQLSDMELDGKLSSANRMVNLRVSNGKIVA
jgi:hypothetical protein